MSTLLVSITAEQPLLLTSLQGDPNSSVSYPYIPGGVLRGAIIHRFRQRQQIGGDLDLGDARTQRLFFSGATRFLNAYLQIAPALADGTVVTTLAQPRGLPLPRSWARRREEAFLTPTADSHPELTEHELQLAKQQRLQVCSGFDLTMAVLNEQRRILDEQGFVALDAHDIPWVASVDRHINIHNQRDRQRGRGVDGSGAVFRYEAIAPGQRFHAAILCADQDDAHALAALLDDGQLWLGGSRSAGYGRVRISHMIVDEWSELGVAPRTRLGGDRLSVCLLSDLIVQDANGMYTTAFPTAALGAALGLSLKVDPTRCFVKTIEVGGFNRTWGLPLPQTPALAAGSVLSFQIQSGELSAPSVDALECKGIGDRRAEGFGRVAVNWHPATASFLARSVDLSWADVRTPVVATLGEESHEIAQQMAQRLLRQRLEQTLVDRVSMYAISGKEVTNTQLARLRIVARRALEDRDLGRVERLLNGLPAATRERLRRARVGYGANRERLLDWLDWQIRESASMWQDVRPVTVAGITVAVEPDLAHEYTLRLIMAVTRLAAKEDR